MDEDYALEELNGFEDVAELKNSNIVGGLVSQWNQEIGDTIVVIMYIKK